MRGRIDWTMRARLVAVGTLAIICADLVGAWWWGAGTDWGSWIWVGVAVLFWVLLLPIGVVLADLLVRPLVWLRKRQIISRARSIVRNCANLKVVGITGSYGKTSTKEILATILEAEFKVVKTPDNINTDIGIAQFIIENEDKLRKVDVFIVEMGAHRRGDIADICQVVAPEYSILTGITSAHLARFGSLSAIIDTKFELPQNTKKCIVLNCDDENVCQNHKLKLKNIASEVEVFCAKSQIAQNISYLSNFAGIEFEVDEQKFQTKLIASHAIALVLLARQIALKLGMTDAQIAQAVSRIAQVPHRLEVTHNKALNRTIIDDSYNGNVVGAASALAVLARAEGRKVVLTPGLVELGDQTESAHRELAQQYAQIVDEVLLIQTPATKYITDELRKLNFTNITTYPTTKAAHDDLANTLRDGDTILFQNDVTDNYL